MKMPSNHLITYTAIGLLGLGLLLQRVPINQLQDIALAQGFPPPSQQSPEVAATASSSLANSPRKLKFNLSISSPRDLLIKQGDTVVPGQVLADRVEERSRLSAQRQVLELSLKQIQAKTIVSPLTPLPVPAVKSLPPISYVEEETAIQTAGINIQQAQNAFAAQQENLKTEPLEESSAVAKAAVEVHNQQHIVDNQHRIIDAVAMLKDLPPSVPVHEQEVLKLREGDLHLVEANYRQAVAKLEAASKAQTEKLQQLAASLEKARAEKQLAIARLQTKKDQRAYTEYEASVTAARQAQEHNQATQNYERQQQESEQQQRDRSFQIAQLQTKIAEVDNQLSVLSTVKSPYPGIIQRVTFTGQNDKNLSVEAVLIVSNTSS